MGKTNFVPIFVILIFLSANQSVSANLRENSDAVNGIIPRKIDVDRQVCFNLIGIFYFYFWSKPIENFQSKEFHKKIINICAKTLLS
jgi:hypothetical protein